MTCLKNLLETQFDENAKFKQILAEQITDPSFLREQPLGRDKDGLCYMCYIDKEFSVRLFAYDARISNDAAKTWRLVCMDLNALKEFVIKLNEEPDLSALRTCKRYLANLAKEEKILKQKQKEIETATAENNLTESKTTLVKEEVKTKIEETQIKEEEKINASADEIKGEPETAVKIEIKPEETVIEKIEELEENKQEAKEEPVAEEEVKEKEPVLEEFDTPIALRKSTRSSLRRGPEPIPLVAKPVVTPKKATPAPKPLQKLEQQVEKPKSTPKKPTKSKSKRGKSSKKDSSCSSESDLEISDDENEVESKCVKCNKVKARQILLLCDGCDAAHHLTCLKPVLNEVPEGDWFCGICEHDKLIKKLQEKIDLIDNHFKELELAKLKSIKKRTNRIADIGANLDRYKYTNINLQIYYY